MTETYTVTGMSCGGCKQNIENALTDLDGVESVTADNENNSVVVEGEFDENSALHAIEDAGYSVEA